jgi:hypothetical protein
VRRKSRQSICICLAPWSMTSSPAGEGPILGQPG